MHLLKNSWQFPFKITEKATHISFEKPQFTFCNVPLTQNCLLQYQSKSQAKIEYRAIQGCLANDIKMDPHLVLNDFTLRTICIRKALAQF